MRASAFQKWFDQFTQRNLNRAQRERVRSALAHGTALAQFAALLERTCQQTRCCPSCASPSWVRHGHAHGLQRYRCRDCGRTYNDLSNTPLSRLRRREQWLDYFGCLVDGKSVRAAANDVGIHRNTAFRWRHRFIGQFRQQRIEPLGGIVEADEMFMLESQKGSRQLTRPARRRGGRASRRGISQELDCILVARDRSKHTWDAVVGRGRLTKFQLDQHLLPKLAPEVLLATDAHAAYGAFAAAHGIAHQAVNLRQGQRLRASMRGAIHVQNVNAYHQRFRQWLARFRGVASRYLGNYLDWRWALDGGEYAEREALLQLAVKPNNRYW